MDISSGNSSDSSVPLLCSSSSSSSSCSEQRQQLLRTQKEEPLSADVADRRKHSGSGEFDSAETSVSSGAGSAPHRASSTPSSGASLLHQQFLQTNGHLSASPAIAQSNGGGFSPGAFSVPMDQMNINSAATPMQAFAAAAANNIGLFCAAPTASVPQFAPSVPSGAFSLMNYGQRPPMVQQLAAVQQQQRIANLSTAANASARKNGPSSATAPAASTSASSSAAAAASSSSINRSQRCGVCRGCQCKPCGLCTYCQDSPQFGGPGVKKQSCIERRCLRVLENRLQRDAPTFKARVGCNACEDCRSPDCQICLVCLDKRFFNGRYMQTTHPCVSPCGALCAKKRCNNATNLELPYSLDRPSLKRPSSDSPGGNAQQTQQYHHNSQHTQQQQQVAKRQLIQQSAPNSASINSNIARILSAAQHGGRGGEGKGTDKYGTGNVGVRTSGGNSATNSPISENGGLLCDVTPSQQQMLFGAARPFWPPSAQQNAIVAHQTQPMLVPLGVPYGAASFDQQMASLAAAAAVGFPSVQQNQHTFNNQMAVYSSSNNNSYPQKFLGYPKYEFFEEGAAAVAALSGGMTMEQQQMHQQHNHQQQTTTTAGVRQGGGTDDGSNPFVPPSYSAERKVVLQPL